MSTRVQLVAAPTKSDEDPKAHREIGRRKKAMDGNMREDVFSLTEGEVSIQWPATLSPESFQDLGDWLDILKRKIGRSVVKSDEAISGGCGESPMEDLVE